MEVIISKYQSIGTATATATDRVMEALVAGLEMPAHTPTSCSAKWMIGGTISSSRASISHMGCERASALVMPDLGPRTDREIEDRLRHDVDEERLTGIDQPLLRRMDIDRTVPPADRDPFQQSVAAGRLRKLKSMDLVKDVGGEHYCLAEGIEDTLRRIGKRGDIVRLMQRELTARQFDRAGVEQVVATELREPIVGRLISRSFSDEHRDRHYMMVDGVLIYLSVK